MGKYVCTVCGYVYDEAAGIPEAGIAPGTAWEDLPEDWVCPMCGAEKASFEKQGGSDPAPAQKPASTEVDAVAAEVDTEMRELSAPEMSALCSNLARGCEKQYLPEEAALFTQLAGYFKAASPSAQAPEFGQLLALIEKDLAEGIPNARAAASGEHDRGALRALTWDEKVTRILKSLLTRYQKEGDTLVENTGVFVCTICGFVYLGDAPPQLCPICKVPNWKFEKVEGR